MRRLTRQIEKGLEDEIAKKSKINPKLFLKHVNSKKKVKSSILELYTSSKKYDMTTDDKVKADIHNFFTSVFTKEAE